MEPTLESGDEGADEQSMALREEEGGRDGEGRDCETWVQEFLHYRDRGIMIVAEGE